MKRMKLSKVSQLPRSENLHLSPTPEAPYHEEYEALEGKSAAEVGRPTPESERQKLLTMKRMKLLKVSQLPRSESLHLSPTPEAPCHEEHEVLEGESSRDGDSFGIVGALQRLRVHRNPRYSSGQDTCAFVNCLSCVSFPPMFTTCCFLYQVNQTGSVNYLIESLDARLRFIANWGRDFLSRRIATAWQESLS